MMATSHASVGARNRCSDKVIGLTVYIGERRLTSFSITLCPPLKRAPCGPFFMADRDRYYGPLFDKIADRQFWARAKRAIRGRAEDEKHAKHVFRNPSLSAKSIRPPCGALLICVATSVFVYERLRIAHLHRNRIDIAAVIAHAITNPCPVPHRDVPHLPIAGRTGAPR